MFFLVLSYNAYKTVEHEFSLHTLKLILLKPYAILSEMLKYQTQPQLAAAQNLLTDNGDDKK